MSDFRNLQLFLAGMTRAGLLLVLLISSASVCRANGGQEGSDGVAVCQPRGNATLNGALTNQFLSETQSMLSDSLEKPNAYLLEAQKRYDEVKKGKKILTRTLDLGRVTGTESELVYLEKLWKLLDDSRKTSYKDAASRCENPAAVLCVLTRFLTATEDAARTVRNDTKQDAKEVALRALTLHESHKILIALVNSVGEAKEINTFGSFLPIDSIYQANQIRTLDYVVQKMGPDLSPAYRDLKVFFAKSLRDACGLYYPGAHMIQLSTGSGCFGPSLVAHEMFHAYQYKSEHIENNQLVALAWKDEKTRKPDARFPSGYAKTNPIEHFAEAGMFAVFAPSELRRTDPKQAAYFENTILKSRTFSDAPGQNPTADLKVHAGNERLSGTLEADFTSATRLRIEYGASREFLRDGEQKNRPVYPVYEVEVDRLVSEDYRWRQTAEAAGGQNPTRLSLKFEGSKKAYGQQTLALKKDFSRANNQARVGVARIRDRDEGASAYGVLLGVRQNVGRVQVEGETFFGTDSKRYTELTATAGVSRHVAAYAGQIWTQNITARPSRFNLGVELRSLRLPQSLQW